MRETRSQVRVARVDEVRAAGRLVVQADGNALVLFMQGERIYAVDNRCPHMGFPLHRGTVKDGILTCHWHHARFDLESGGTFDRFADDVRTFPTEIRDGDVWVDLASSGDVVSHQRDRLRESLEYDIPLVMAKAVISLLDAGEEADEPFRIGLEFGVRNRKAGWGQGLTILTCMRNLLPFLGPEDRPRALYHGLAAVASNTFNEPARFDVRPLPSAGAPADLIQRWYRGFIEVRDDEGAERCLVSAIRGGVPGPQIAVMMFAATTDHRYLSNGHVFDFTNKAFEALDHVGWRYAEQLLTSLVRLCASAERMEESSAWRHPIDLVKLLEQAFEALPGAVAAGRGQDSAWGGREILLDVLLGEDAHALIDGLLNALREGAGFDALAGVVTYAAALRLARFHTSNEFPDWDTAHHTFTFANAVQQALRRSPSLDVLRGVFDAAASVYLDRFLNVPPALLPEPQDTTEQPEALLGSLRALLDRQQQVNEAGVVVGRYLYSGGDPHKLLATLGHLLLREDRNFHAIQAMEASFRQFESLRSMPAGTHMLVAAIRYLAAHAPTVRAQGQTYQIAHRLNRGERLHAEPERRLATVLFVDIVDSTSLLAELGDRRWRDLLRAYHGIVRTELARHQGQEVNTAGDGVLATFDVPARAIRFARALDSPVRRLGIQVRAGLHTGEVEVMGDGVSGLAVHIGARVAALAGAGEVMATSTVRDLVVGSGVRFEDRGRHPLKGVPGEWQLFAVS